MIGLIVSGTHDTVLATMVKDTNLSLGWYNIALILIIYIMELQARMIFVAQHELRQRLIREDGALNHVLRHRENGNCVILQEIERIPTTQVSPDSQ